MQLTWAQGYQTLQATSGRSPCCHQKNLSFMAVFEFSDRLEASCMHPQPLGERNHFRLFSTKTGAGELVII